MPELPEVEIHARALRRWLLGKRIARHEVLDPKLAPDPGAWASALPGRRVTEIRRRAKYLLVDLEGGHTAVIHLRMTGKLRFEPYTAGPPARATRLVVHLAEPDVGRVLFDDFRRFGRVWVAPTPEVGTLPELAGLGPDALLEPTSGDRLHELASGRRRAIKALLMDQRLIGGLGNICAIEVLFRAGIAPSTPACDLSPDQTRRIAEIIPPYLEWAIRAQSHRELIYLGEPGAENVFSIYGRAGTPCPNCSAPIVRSVVAGRGTYHCPECQR